MAVTYITDQGSCLYKSGDRLYIKKGSTVIRWILTKDIDQLILLGNIALSAQCVTYLLRNRIDTVFLTYYGAYKGRLVSEFGKNIQLRIAQFRFLEDNSRKIDLARRYIKAKLFNSINFLQNRYYRYKNEEISKALIRNRAILKYRLDECRDLDTLSGYEGIAAKNYFGAFPYLITNEHFPFKGRNKRPPKDEVNALLSLCYTILMSHITGKVYTAGLDPYYGSLHQINYGRQSLVLDLMEEYRPFVDDMIITMINKRDIRLSHFIYNRVEDDEFMAGNDQNTQILPVSLNKDGMKKVVFRFSTLLNRYYYYDYLQARFSLSQIIMSQVRRLVKHITYEKNYEGFTISTY